MDIPINAEVHCSDGPVGTVRCVIINPIIKKVTDIAVGEKHFPLLEVLIPLKLIARRRRNAFSLAIPELNCETGSLLLRFSSFLATTHIMI